MQDGWVVFAKLWSDRQNGAAVNVAEVIAVCSWRRGLRAGTSRILLVKFLRCLYE